CTPDSCTARSPSSTRSGPTGMPALRSARAKWTMFSDRLIRAAGDSTSGDFFEYAGDFVAANGGDVVLVLEQDAEGVVHGGGIQGLAVEFRQRARPVDGFRNARALEQVHGAQLLHEGHDVGGKALGDVGQLAPDDL